MLLNSKDGFEPLWREEYPPGRFCRVTVLEWEEASETMLEFTYSLSSDGRPSDRLECHDQFFKDTTQIQSQ